MLGEAPRFVSVPPTDDFDFACHVAAPATDGAVAPGPPLPVLPYVTVIVAPAASVTVDTVIVCAATETVPVLATV